MSTKKRIGDTTDTVLQKLLEAIVNGSFVPGEPIRETQIAKEWGVSRTPVREAVRSAAAMGLIELRNNQRPLINNFEQKDLNKLTDVRVAIELLAFDSSIDNLIKSRKVKKLLDQSIKLQNFTAEDFRTEKALELDTNLHRLWVDSCDNRFIVLAFESLWTFIRILQRTAAGDYNRAATALYEHHAILQAMYMGKTHVARTLLKQHLTSSTPILHELLKKP